MSTESNTATSPGLAAASSSYMFTQHTWPSLISRARGVVVSHPLSMREALGSIPSVSMDADMRAAAVQYICSSGIHRPGSRCVSHQTCNHPATCLFTTHTWPSFISRARGVVVSHPLSMREALGSIPSVSMLKAAAAMPNQK